MHTEKQFDTGELTLNYMDSGTSGAPLVLLHGMTGRWQSWSDLLPELEAHWHVYAFDLRGHGKSGRGASYRFEDYGRDIAAFLHSLSEPATVMGHSLGGLTAMAAASEVSERLRAVILIDPPLFTRNTSIETTPGFKNWFTIVYETVKGTPSYESILTRCRELSAPDAPEAAVRSFAEQLAGVDPEAAKAALEDDSQKTMDYAGVLQAIRCPTLLLQGDWSNGGAIRDEDAEFFRANFPAAKIVQIVNGGHLGPDQHKETILRQMNAFLQTV